MLRLRSRPAPGRGLRRCDSASVVRRAGPDPLAASNGMSRGAGMRRRRTYRRATDGRSVIPSDPRAAGRRGREHARSKILRARRSPDDTRYSSTPVLARYCHLPIYRYRGYTCHVDRFIKRHAHPCMSRNPHVSPNSQSSQYRHTSVRSHRLPHVLGVTDNRHTRRDNVAEIIVWYRHPPTCKDSPRT